MNVRLDIEESGVEPAAEVGDTRRINAGEKDVEQS
jgi:hypothetical protein